MRNLGFAVLAGVTLLQGVTAACCRGNKCLKAIISAGQDGHGDCATNLVVTVTQSANPLTETVTAIESAVATDLFTEDLTETATTQTLLFTETTTVTASETDIVSEIVTAVVTTTDVLEAATITSISYIYQSAPTLKARHTAPDVPLPGYASGVCDSWRQYANACKCAGYETITVTVPAAGETVTVTAANVVTTTATTLSITETDTVALTATILMTDIDISALTETATATTVVTDSTTTTILATSTPTSVIPVNCMATGLSFFASYPFPDGTTRFMEDAGSIIQYVSFSPAPSYPATYYTTFVLDSDGYLELASPLPGQSWVLTPAFNPNLKGASQGVRFMNKSLLEANIAAGTMVRLRGCIDPDTGELTLSATGRSNILSCLNQFYLSSGNGSDLGIPCITVTPTAVLV